MLRARIADAAKRLAFTAALAFAAGCDSRQSLVGPDSGESTRATSPVLPADSVLREGVLLSVGVRASERGRPVRVRVLVLDDSRSVVWQSAEVETDSAVAVVALTGLGSGLVGREWFLTASAERGGRRVYADSDSTGATSLGEAATRRVRVFGGASVALGRGVRALVADGRTGTAFFALAGSGEVGALDLGQMVLRGPVVRDRGEVRDLDVSGHTLAYLADAGSRVSFLDLRDSAVRERVVDPLQVQLRRTTVDASGQTQVDTALEVVRPYATVLRLACDDAPTECASPVALLGSPTQGGGSVIRLVRPGGARDGLLVMGYTRLPAGPDTVPAAVTVVAPIRPGGEDEAVLERPRAAGCASLHAGLLGFSPSAGAALFAAGGGACGPGARIVRVDAFRGGAPALSQLGVATMQAEDRIDAPVEVAASADGSRVLVREPDAVWLLDRDLRILGYRAVSTRARVAWLREQRAGALQFMIADGETLEVFEADQFGSLESVQVGPVSGAPLAFVTLSDGRRVAVFVAAEQLESLVVLTLPPR